MKAAERPNVSPWFALAAADIAVAEWVCAIVDATRELDGLACFHAQQAAEKAVKGLLAAAEKPTPRTHDLAALAAAVPIPAHEHDLIMALTDLAEYGVMPSYPTVGLMLSRLHAERALQDALTVVAWARQMLDARC